MLPTNFQHEPPAVAPARRSWWHRHWKLAVAIGAVAAVVGAAGFVYAVCALTFGLMKGSGAYKQAVAAARADAEVARTLGTPIEEGFFVMGEVRLNHDDSGFANLSIPITGPNGEATIYAEADKSRGQWSFHTLEVMVEDTGQWIHLD